ncbi:MAG: phosphoribosylamine--glycine ligase [Candidatus Zapsychrus exili]|nr:phosphoribosylamine--glycine ligase [Candidatus Zapsychrus exili]
MKVLVVGSGGREHTLVWKIKQSSKVKEVFCAPGNGGIESIAECVDIKADDIEGLAQFALERAIDLTVIGPEVPLAAGSVDVFEEKGLKVFGPSKKAAQLEGSKAFSKEFMYKYGIPTAAFKVFEDINKAKDFLLDVEFPIVIKADGLAAGKGVIICKDKEEADEALKQIMEDKVFKEAGEKIIIEECLVGEEVSILAVSDGENYLLLDSSQDHKRIFDDDLGPNTGGMGAYSPAPVATQEMFRTIEELVINPTIDGMIQEGAPFKGILYAGLMITEKGPFVLEFNVRLGDPETQAILPRLKSDIIDVMIASCEGRLNEAELLWDKRACVCVVMSSGGYPGAYDKGCEIQGLDKATEGTDAVIFHAGTKNQDGKIVTSGGRVLGITGFGDDIGAAIRNTYEVVEKVKFDRCFFRRDIGAKALKNTVSQ